MLGPLALVLLGCNAGDGTPDPPTTTTTDVDSGTDSAQPLEPCEPGELGLGASWDDAHPAVPRLRWNSPADATAAALSYQAGSWEHTWVVENGALGDDTFFALPMTPGVTTGLTLRVDLDDGRCLTESLILENGNPSVAGLPPLVSTWDDAASTGGRDWFLLFAELERSADDSANMILLFQDDGAMVAAYPVESMRTAYLAGSGEGIWQLDQSNEYNTADISAGAVTDLRRLSWDGVPVEHYDQVTYGHHDWALGDDEGSVYVLTREVLGSIQDRCGTATFGDRVVRHDLASGVTEVLWSATDDAFPLLDGCDAYPDGELVSYLNGINRLGNTLGVSAAGIHNGMLVGTANGDWLFVTDNPDVSYMNLENGLGRSEPIQAFQAVHSVTCDEDRDWGAGDAWTDDAIPCLVSNRRQDPDCHTVDLVVVEPSKGRARWLASWPEIGSDACVVVENYGNATPIGLPNPAGDGLTRVALYSPDVSRTDVLSLQVSPDGTAAFERVYSIVESPSDTDGHIKGFYMTAWPGLGDSHSVARIPSR